MKGILDKETTTIRGDARSIVVGYFLIDALIATILQVERL